MRRSGAVAAAAVLVLALVAAHWRPASGFDGLIRFGQARADRRLPALSSLALAAVPGQGYDGQYYAQLAVSPHPDRPEVRAALDNPSYRARRILLSAVAHVLGAGNPGLTLQIYALENVAAWLALGGLLWLEVGALPRRRAEGVWIACLLSLGALDSVRLALTDLTAVLFIAWAARSRQSDRPSRAVAVLALAGLTRETALLAAPVLAGTGWPKGSEGKARALAAWAGRAALAALPLALWLAWLGWEIPRSGWIWRGNFDWPGAAWLRHDRECLAHLARGDWDTRWSFGLLGALGLAWQSLELLGRPRWPDPWWRAGAGFALLFWVLGGDVWRGYWAAARVVLPMTLAFNLLAPRGRWFWLRLGATNSALVLHGLWRLAP